ncbi:TonB-dependent receptor [uncultured Polaribacter sp.]|uniref:TonB-dependent receptor n=1 Tax=uncultured Polaribacter sp. TaxID=174711 RepID=UPI002620FF08|nr:TonB-dependent receptor [uncultured Polaribacter sp.]
MLQPKRLYIFFFFISFLGFSQENVTLSGTIYDDANNETLIGVSVYFPELNSGTTTNQYGFYSITVPKGKYKILISYLGFTTIAEEIELVEKTTKSFKLKESTESLDEIVIESNVENLNIKTPQMSVNRLTSASIKKIPVVLGEADVIKSLILLPGVTSAGEGASGFNVRGGAADQNLILLDEAIVFNSSHLFGFFSVFNPDVIKDVKLYKGGIPAKYGGRLSSVLDIYQKEGNSKEFKATGGIGLISSRLLIEGPIKEEKISFLIGGRSSYAHLFLPLADIDNTAYFYDLNTKINYRIDDKNNLFFSGYFGKDVFGINDSFVNTYGNQVANLRWNHLFSDKIFSNLSLIYSDYFYGLILDFVGFEWDSGITNYNVKYDINHFVNNDLELSYGINNIYSQFNPGEISPNRPDSTIENTQLIQKFSNEFAAYIDAEHTISDKLRLQYGLRFSNFIRLGQDELNVYENDEAVVYNDITRTYASANRLEEETLTFDRRDVITSFNNFEPRFALSYLINDDSSLKVSYNRMAQYLHLLTNTASPTPLDIWAPSGKYIKPQLLDQFAIGYFKTMENGMFTIETEAFYKDIQNRIDYINGADLVANDAIETVILNGQARAYGLEVLFKKNKGDFTGWLAYTLSRSEQQTPGRTPNEPGINAGEWYSTPFDKTHDVSLNTSYSLNKKWTFNANLTYQTGQPTNYPVALYEGVEGIEAPLFDSDRRNADRLPAFHRLDVSAILTPTKNKNRKWQGEWVFGIYNIYNRQNAASIVFRQNEETRRSEAVQTSIFGIVPSVTYNFNF